MNEKQMSWPNCSAWFSVKIHEQLIVNVCQVNYKILKIVNSFN